MTTTARISATKDQATYNVSLGGTEKHFAALGLAGDERIIVKLSNSSSAYNDPLMYRDQGGIERTAELTRSKNTITLRAGDVQFFKPPTANTVELVEYT